ncbi:MAG: hypothetical protein WB760_34235, partial [Xanthobacteraceae bacterium]
MPPKSRRPLPSTKRIDLNRFYAHRRTLSKMVFLKLILCRLKKRHTALRLPAIRRLRIAATISSSVKSGCSAITARKKSACASSGEMLPPLGLGAMLPVSRRRWIHLIAALALTSKHYAASRRDAPDSTASTTRSRNSKEHGFGIDPPPKLESTPPDSLIQTSRGIPIPPSRNPL